MDNKLEKYQKAVMNILTEYSKIKYANVQGENQVVADKENNRFLIMTIGWQKNHFVHDCPMHFDIINGKVWIQYDGTEDGVGYDLEAAGIPKEDIVPAFHPENVRMHTGYGIS